eukprot:5440662-Ditylum_brightwellii.AAC.1
MTGACCGRARWSSRRNLVTLRLRRDRSLARVLRETYLRQDFRFELPPLSYDDGTGPSHFVVPD